MINKTSRRAPPSPAGRGLRRPPPAGLLLPVAKRRTYLRQQEMNEPNTDHAGKPATFSELLETIPEAVLIVAGNEDFAERLAAFAVGMWQAGSEHGRTVALADVGDGKVSAAEIEKARSGVIAADAARALIAAALSGQGSNAAH